MQALRMNKASVARSGAAQRRVVCMVSPWSLARGKNGARAEQNEEEEEREGRN